MAKVADDAPGWMYYLVEIPDASGKIKAWTQYSMPTREKERSSQQKAALRRLERIATMNGVKVQASHKRKTD